MMVVRSVARSGQESLEIDEPKKPMSLGCWSLPRFLFWFLVRLGIWATESMRVVKLFATPLITRIIP